MLNKLKYLVLSLIVGLSARGYASGPVGDDQTPVATDGVVMVFDEHGHEVPFPRNAIIIFPWEIVEGFWTATIGEIPGIFEFAVDATEPANKRLRIAYLDQTRTRVLATGMGYIDGEQKSIHARIEGTNINATIVVSAYKLKENGGERTELVTSVLLKGTTRPDGDNYVIRKVRK